MSPLRFSLVAAIACPLIYAGSPRETVASCIVLEAVSEGEVGMRAVASVIQNRMWRDGRSALEIIREPHQFQGFYNSKDPIARALEISNDEQWDYAMCLAAHLEGDGWLLSPSIDNTEGATHFHRVGIRPSWSLHLTPTVRIGMHQFYREERRRKKNSR